MRLTITYLILFISFLSYGQDVFKSGYIVKNNNDTIRGLLRNDVDEKLSGQVVFKSANGNTEIFTPINIVSFGFVEGNVFRIVKYIDPTEAYSVKQHFAKILFEGTNDLFSFIKKDMNYFVVHIKEDTTLLLFDDITTASGAVIDEGNYKNQLFFIGHECEKMKSQAENTPYREEALVKYMVSLEKCIGNESGSNVYYVKPETQTQIYFFAGGFPLGKQYEITAQGTVRFVLPSRGRKTSLNTGAVYLRNKSIDTYAGYFGSSSKYDHLVDIFEVPLTIQYNMIDKRIQPYLYGGFGLAYKRETSFPGSKDLKGDFGLTLIGGIGIEGRVAKNFFVKVDWRYDLLLHYPAVAIGFRLK